ncbi:hypothetical protein HYG82_09205 [Natrinema halophilum]|uniref:Lanthionine synthetase C-like protein n=1 Tax=Natrinema halophilum TaxID=1699371 RepID=A0A7D5KL70_9EURY|nr:hypothetical protein HYG82_09205 [Natrinema halophilum]
MLRDEEFVTDRTYDVEGGSAGTILGLLALNERYGSEDLVAFASERGDYLLKNRTESESGYRVWTTLKDCPPLAGFLHGISGIAYSLVRLYNTTGDDRYLDAATEALEYEAHVFSETASNWPDLRPWTNSEFADGWSHGRTGIGLSRLGMSRYVSNELIERDLVRSRDTEASHELFPVDSVANGNCGRIEFLLETETEKDGTASNAHRLLGKVID